MQPGANTYLFFTSFCFVMIKQPLYGYLREKLQVATRVYFDEKDFSRRGILEVIVALQ